MLLPKSILVPMDFSPNSQEALDHAIVLALRFGADLNVVHVRALHEDHYTASDSPIPGADEFRKRVRKLAESIPGSDPDAMDLGREVVRAPFVAQGVLDHIEDVKPDLVVMGTHGRTGIAHIFLGSVAARVVRMSPVHVLTVGRPQEWATGKAIDRVVVPVDYSEHSKEAFLHGVELTRALGAKMILTHVVDDVPHPAFYLGGSGSILDVFPDLRNRALAKMTEWIRDADAADLIAETMVVEGRVHKKIAEVAREHRAGLIVMGSHGLSGFDRLFLGSVTERVVRMAPSPVLAVKPKVAKETGKMEEGADCTTV